MLYLLANTIGISMTIAFDGALVNSDGLWLRAVVAAISGQWNAFEETQQRITLFCANSPQYLFPRFVLNLHEHIVHALLKLIRDRGKRLLDKQFKWRQKWLFAAFFLNSLVRSPFILFNNRKWCLAHSSTTM